MDASATVESKKLTESAKLSLKCDRYHEDMAPFAEGEMVDSSGPTGICETDIRGRGLPCPKFSSLVRQHVWNS